MPSGHSSTSAAFAASIWLETRRGRVTWALGAGAFGIAVLSALSRVVLGVDYPFDVIAGACVGVGCACLLSALPDPLRPAELG